MDLRALFAETGIQLLSEFRKAAQAGHMGGRGTLREDAFERFLNDHLPGRYSVGRGEIVSALNEKSGQIDVIIYDPSRCPVLLRSPSHGLFPIESVFGVVSIKSDLNSTQLAEAYANIRSAKQLVNPKSFTVAANGFARGVGSPQPVGVVFSYQSSRSLEAIAKQAASLDEGLDDLKLRPDFIVVLDKGIVGPRAQIRGDFNSFDLPIDSSNRTKVRKTGRHTLLRAYLQLLAELNPLELRDLDLTAYLNMPERIGRFLVRRPNFVRHPIDSPNDGKVTRISKTGLQKIVSYCKKIGAVSGEQHLKNTIVANIDLYPDDLKASVFEYNPNALPPLDPTKIKMVGGKPVSPAGCFTPLHLQINGESYAIDFSSLDEQDFEERTDIDVDELFAE